MLTPLQALWIDTVPTLLATAFLESRDLWQLLSRHFLHTTNSTLHVCCTGGTPRSSTLLHFRAGLSVHMRSLSACKIAKSYTCTLLPAMRSERCFETILAGKGNLEKRV